MTFNEFNSQFDSTKIVLVEIDDYTYIPSDSIWTAYGNNIWVTPFWWDHLGNIIFSYGQGAWGHGFYGSSGQSSTVLPMPTTLRASKINTVYTIIGDPAYKVNAIDDLIGTTNAFYFDPVTQLMYLTTPSGVSPSIEYTSDLKVGIVKGFSNYACYIDSIYYDPRVKSLPQITTQKDALTFGKISYVGGVVSFINEDGFFDDWNGNSYSSNLIPNKVKFGSKINFLYGSPDINSNEFLPIYSGFIKDIKLSKELATIKFSDDRAKLKSSVGNNTFNTAVYPTLRDDLIGTPIPIGYGTVVGQQAFCTNDSITQSVYSFKFCDTTYHPISNLNNVFVNGVLIYSYAGGNVTSINLTNATFNIASAYYSPGDTVHVNYIGYTGQGCAYFNYNPAVPTSYPRLTLPSYIASAGTNGNTISFDMLGKSYNSLINSVDTIFNESYLTNKALSIGFRTVGVGQKRISIGIKDSTKLTQRVVYDIIFPTDYKHNLVDYDTWLHIDFVLDNSGPTTILSSYVNGEIVKLRDINTFDEYYSIVLPEKYIYSQSGSIGYIGSMIGYDAITNSSYSINGSSGVIDSLIRNFRIYSEPLTSTEVYDQQVYNRVPYSILAKYDFVVGADDMSGNSRNPVAINRVNIIGEVIEKPLDIIKDLIVNYVGVPFNNSFFDVYNWKIESSKYNYFNLAITEQSKALDEIIEKISSSCFGSFLINNEGKYVFKSSEAYAQNPLTYNYKGTIHLSDILEQVTIDNNPNSYFSSLKLEYGENKLRETFNTSITTSGSYTDDIELFEIYNQNKQHSFKLYNQLLQPSYSYVKVPVQLAVVSGVQSRRITSLSSILYDTYAGNNPIFNVKTKTNFLDFEVSDLVLLQVERKEDIVDPLIIAHSYTDKYIIVEVVDKVVDFNTNTIQWKFLYRNTYTGSTNYSRIIRYKWK